MGAAIGLLVMMYPILCKVRYETLHLAFHSRDLWLQIAFSIVLNWFIAPLLMVCGYLRIIGVMRTQNLTAIQLGLAWAFLPDEEGLREGLILVGLARCIAMVKS